MNKVIYYLLNTSIYNTVRINFFKLPFYHAIKFPFLVSRGFRIENLKGDIIFENTKIEPGMVKLGFVGTSFLDRKKNLGVIELNGKWIISGKADIGVGTALCINGLLTTSHDFKCTGGSKIICYKEIFFGKEVLISWETTIIDTDFHNIFFENELINENEQISIMDNVWIGFGVKVLKGSFIPTGSVIGSNSIISKKLQHKNSIYIEDGKVIRKNINWKI